MDKIEQRIEQIEKFASQCYEDGEKYSAFIAGAIWADNNPDLSVLWHSASEEPQVDDWAILCQDNLGNFPKMTEERTQIYYPNSGWKGFVKLEGIRRWAYIDDLLPKQFGNSEQLKGGEQ